MVFGLFGGKSQEDGLRSSLSKDTFMEEFEKTVDTFGVVATNTAGKSPVYGEIEAMSRFVFEQVMKTAASAGTINTAKDLEAAATMCVVLVQCFGRNGGLSKTDCQVLQGTVPGFVFPRTLGDKFKENIGDAVTKAVVRYARQIDKKAFRKNVEAVEGNLTQFLTHRKTDYYAILAGDIARFR